MADAAAEPTTEWSELLDADEQALVERLIAENKDKGEIELRVEQAAPDEGEFQAEIAPIAVWGIIVGSVTLVALIREQIEINRGAHVIDLRPGVSPWLYRQKGTDYRLIFIRKSELEVEVKVSEIKTVFEHTVDAVKAVVADITEKLSGIAKDWSPEQLGEFLRKLLRGRADVNVKPLTPA
jgi:transcription termination factor NusB